MAARAAFTALPSGDSGKYIIKPVLTVTSIVSSAAQRVVGYVDGALAVGGTTISLQQSGVSVKGTVPCANGSFVLSGPRGHLRSSRHVVWARDRGDDRRAGHDHHGHHGQRFGDGHLAASSHAANARRGEQCEPGDSDCACGAGAERRPDRRNAPAPVDATSGDFTFALPIDPPVRTANAADFDAGRAPRWAPTRSRQDRKVAAEREHRGRVHHAIRAVGQGKAVRVEALRGQMASRTTGSREAGIAAGSKQ